MGCDFLEINIDSFNEPEDLENLKKFLSSEKPWEYDFELCAEFENGFDAASKTSLEEFKNLNTYERYFTFKASSPFDKRYHKYYPNANKFSDDCSEKYPWLCDPDGSPNKDGDKFYRLPQAIYSALWGWQKDKDERYGTSAKFGVYLGCDTINSVQTIMNLLFKAVDTEKFPCSRSIPSRINITA